MNCSDRLNIFIDDAPLIASARIKVIGVGGGGSNAINRMIQAGIVGVDFLVANTDLQALRYSLAPTKIQLGRRLTRGLGAGADPAIGREAALQEIDPIIEVLEDADLVFVTSGLGGGTGTGAAPIIAGLASELGALTVAVVTKPFSFEGHRRMQKAEVGLSELRECADCVITIPNEKLLWNIHKDISLYESFRFTDEVLRQAIQGISDLVNVPGVINLDFADVRTIMSGMGTGLMGIGKARGENRAINALQQAMCCPLMEGVAILGARAVLINFTAGPNLTLHEVNEASSIIRDAAHVDANIIFGAVIDESLSDEVKVTLIATGFTENAQGPINLIPEVIEDRGYEAPLSNTTPESEEADVPRFLRKAAN
jgi:cell division protein FtsZ